MNGIGQRIWQSSLVNLTLVILLFWLWYQGTFTVQGIAILALALALIVNSGLWLGWRLAQMSIESHRSLKPLLFFAIGGFAAILAIVDLSSKDYGSAGFLLMGSVGVVVLGLMTMRGAKKGDGDSQHP